MDCWCHARSCLVLLSALAGFPTFQGSKFHKPLLYFLQHDSFHVFAGIFSPRRPVHPSSLRFPAYLPDLHSSVNLTRLPGSVSATLTPSMGVAASKLLSLDFNTVLGRGTNRTALGFHPFSCPTRGGVSPPFRFSRAYTTSPCAPLPGVYNYDFKELSTA